MRRIIFCGAQGTGKTTVLNYYEKMGYNCITEVVRKLAKDGTNINESGDAEGQLTIFNKYAELLGQQTSYISDRGLIDVTAYSEYLKIFDEKLKDVVNNQRNYIKEFVKTNPDIVYCYFPIEFPIVDDGIRSLNENFRNYIDNKIKELLDTYIGDYYVIKGTRDERIRQINNIIEQMKLNEI